jgi:hypothetical protein
MTVATAVIVHGMEGGTSSAPVANADVSTEWQTWGIAMQKLLADAGWVKEPGYGTQIDFATTVPAYTNPGGTATYTYFTAGYTLYKFNDLEQTAADGLPVHIKIDWNMRRDVASTTYTYEFYSRATFYLGLDLTVSGFRSFTCGQQEPLPLYTYSTLQADPSGRTFYACSLPGFNTAAQSGRLAQAGFFAAERVRDVTTGATVMGAEAGLALQGLSFNGGQSSTPHAGVLRAGDISPRWGTSRVLTTMPGGQTLSAGSNQQSTMSFNQGNGDVLAWPALPVCRNIGYMPGLVAYSHNDIPQLVPVSIPTRMAGTSYTYLPLGVDRGRDAVQSSTANAFANACFAIRYE